VPAQKQRRPKRKRPHRRRPCGPLPTRRPRRPLPLPRRQTFWLTANTYGQPSGNRFAEGERGGPPRLAPGGRGARRGVRLGRRAPLEGGTTVWVAALADGRIEAFRLDEAGEVERRPVTLERLSPGTPPTLKADEESLELLVSRSDEALSLPIRCRSAGAYSPSMRTVGFWQSPEESCGPSAPECSPHIGCRREGRRALGTYGALRPRRPQRPS
jgi:hypothetical protein